MSLGINRGFTLVEVMVSLAIMAIVATVAFSGLRIGLSGWEHGSKAIDQLDRREMIERLIRKQLAVAYPMKMIVNKQESPFFRGSANRLEFISDYSLADGPSDFRKIDYGVADGKFIYGEKPLYGYTPAEAEDLSGEPLATEDRASFRFLAADSKGNPQWVDEWTFGMGIPPVIQVTLDDDTFWVSMVNR